MKVTLPTILQQIQDYLVKNPAKLSGSTADGRTASTADETLVIEHLRKKFGNIIQNVPIRRAGDMLIVLPNQEPIVVNIKTTHGSTADNAQSWGGYLLAFTDLPYDSIKPSYNFKVWAELITKHSKETPRDYWFLVITKDSQNQKVLIRGLKQVACVSANPVNFLQIHWGKEIKRVAKSFSFAESWNNLVNGVVVKAYQKRLKSINEGLAFF